MPTDTAPPTAKDVAADKLSRLLSLPAHERPLVLDLLDSVYDAMREIAMTSRSSNDPPPREATPAEADTKPAVDDDEDSGDPPAEPAPETKNDSPALTTATEDQAAQSSLAAQQESTQKAFDAMPPAPESALGGASPTGLPPA